MHFHLATLLLLVPLLTAAPTPNLEQRVPPADVAAPLTETLGKLTETLGGDLTSPPTSNARRQAEDITKPLTETLDRITKIAPSGKREESKDITQTLTGTLGKLTKPLGGDLTNVPTGKRQAPTAGNDVTPVSGIAEILKDVIKESKGFQSSERSRKRQAPAGGDIDVTSGIAGILKDIIKEGESFQSSERKRQAPAGGDIDVTSGIAGILKDIIKEGESFQSERKRQSTSPVDAVTLAVGLLTGSLGEAGAPVKRQEDAAAAAELISALMKLAEEYGSGALAEGKLPGDLKLPEEIETPDASSPSKRFGVDMGSVVKSVADKVIDSANV